MTGLRKTLWVLIIALSACAQHVKAPAQHVKPTPAPPRWGAASTRELQTAVRGALAPAIAAAYTWSCAIVAQDGTLLYQDRSANAVVPASVQKLIVADAVLRVLGAHYRYHTFLETAGGDLWLAGSGDPSLRTDDLRRGVGKLRAAGLQSVGRVGIDATALAGPELNPHWDLSDINKAYMAATSGISIDEDTVEFRITGTTSGRPARVRLKPQTGFVSYTGSVETGEADDVNVTGAGTPNAFLISGTIPPGKQYIFYLPLHGIPRYAGAVLGQFLRDAGIALTAAPVMGAVPAGAKVVWDHPSPELTQLVRHMMLFSDNHFAEQFLRTLGGRWGAADDAHGLAVERHLLQTEHVPIPGLQLVDGSGLADVNHVAAITLVRVLSQNDSLYLLLPRGGLDGTLKRYRFHQARGRVRAKSGHLAGVSSLAGYIATRRHGRVVFAFLIDGPRQISDDAMIAAVDRIAQR